MAAGWAEHSVMKRAARLVALWVVQFVAKTVARLVALWVAQRVADLVYFLGGHLAAS